MAKQQTTQKTNQLKNQLRKEMALDNINYRLTIGNWTNWLLDHNNQRVTSIARGLIWGAKTGRITNINAKQELINPKTFKPFTNLQVLTIIAKAAIIQNTLSASESVNALQKTMNKTVKIL